MTADKSKTMAVPGKARGKSATSPAGREDPHVAHALRSAYEETVKEDVPAAFLDLLGKLA